MVDQAVVTQARPPGIAGVTLLKPAVINRDRQAFPGFGLVGALKTFGWHNVSPFLYNRIVCAAGDFTATKIHQKGKNLG
jgi:hypothetical protein